MRCLLRFLFLPLLLAVHGGMVNAAVGSAGSANTAATNLSTAAPAGFEDLEKPREMLLDVFFGGEKVGEAVALISPGKIRFRHPDAVLKLLPNISGDPQLASALAVDLPSNGGLACGPGETISCGKLFPQVIGIIYDEENFRIDVFINPKFQRIITPTSEVFLPNPAAPLSLTSSFGLAVSGNGRSTLYNFQDRTVAGFGSARVRSDFSYASHVGLLVDNLTAELDRPNRRYSAGLFWAPGVDLIGQRRIIGVGMGTQFDTRVDRDSLRGTPLIVFLSQPARVEILIDGRLVSSRSYEAGNNELDTSGLPEGAYSLLLRIHEAGGSVREERRFFVKNSQVPPTGQPLYFAYAGFLANTRQGQPISISNKAFYQIGTARRLNRSLAFSLSLIGTQDNAMLEAGGWLITRLARARTAALVSSRGDKAALFQLGSTFAGPLSMDFDLRRVWSHDGRPLLPAPEYIASFDSTVPTSAQLGNGSYSQATGSIGIRIGAGSLGIIGSYRKDKGLKADYTVGPTLVWPIVNRGGFQVTLQADGQKTRTTTAGFLGVRMVYSGRRISVSSSSGRAWQDSGDPSQSSPSRLISSTSVQYGWQGADRTQVSLEAGVDRNLDSTTLHAGGVAFTQMGSLRTDVLQAVDGGHHLQYGVTFQSGAAVAGGRVHLGGRDLTDSAIVVDVDGAGKASTFEVLVNGSARGRVASGGSLPIFLEPYRRYNIRLRPVDSASVAYDSNARQVTLYPGNVQKLHWHVERLLTVFGQAFRTDGSPVETATVQSRRGLGETDAHGYFQIEVGADDELTFTGHESTTCHVRVAGVIPHDDYASMGRVLCR